MSTNPNLGATPTLEGTIEGWSAADGPTLFGGVGGIGKVQVSGMIDGSGHFTITLPGKAAVTAGLTDPVCGTVQPATLRWGQLHLSIPSGKLYLASAPVDAKGQQPIGTERVHFIYTDQDARVDGYCTDSRFDIEQPPQGAEYYGIHLGPGWNVVVDYIAPYDNSSEPYVNFVDGAIPQGGIWRVE